MIFWRFQHHSVRVAGYSFVLLAVERTRRGSASTARKLRCLHELCVPVHVLEHIRAAGSRFRTMIKEQGTQPTTVYSIFLYRKRIQKTRRSRALDHEYTCIIYITPCFHHCFEPELVHPANLRYRTPPLPEAPSPASLS